MTRRKVTMAYIPSNPARKASFRKRKQGLMKKMGELNILCDIESLLIIFGPDEPLPEVWPSRVVADELLGRFMSISDFEKGRKMIDHVSYLKDRIDKTRELVDKHAKRNRELQALQFLTELQSMGKRLTDFSSGDLNEIVWFMEMKRREIARRRNMLMYGADFAGHFSHPSALEHLASPSSPQTEVCRPYVTMDVPESKSGLDKSEAEASIPVTMILGTQDLVFIPPSSRVDTGASLINSHDTLARDQWLSGLMNAAPNTQNVACNTRHLWGDNVSGALADPNVVPEMIQDGAVLPGDGSWNLEVELPRENAGGSIHGNNATYDYAFVGQDYNIGGLDKVPRHHLARPANPTGFEDGFVLPQMNFEDNIFLDDFAFAPFMTDVMNGATGGGNQNTIGVAPTHNTRSNFNSLFYP